MNRRSPLLRVAHALVGVINLVSKAPTGDKEVLLNRRTLGVTDAATWLSHRLSKDVGVSLLAAGTTQSAEDVDGDGWADQARARRWSIRPRLNAVDARGRSLFVTAGLGYDDRSGGSLGGGSLPKGQQFTKALLSRRADIGATASVPSCGSGTLAVRFAYSSSARERTFGPGPREDDRMSTGFLEVTRSCVTARTTTVLGGAVQVDEFADKLNRAFDHRWFTPGVFVTSEHTIGAFTLSASIRGDAHPDAGTQLTERVSVLVKPTEGWSVRASVGTGVAAPAATTEETEATGLRAIVAGRPLQPEKSVGAMLDVNGEIAGGELLVTAYGSTISAAIQLADSTAAGGSAMLHNAGAATRIGGVEAAAVWRFGISKLIATYGYSRGSRLNPMTAFREDMPMIPRHRFGLDLMFEKRGAYRGGLEGT